MGTRVEILNEGGFRSDGRKQYELRNIAIDLSQQATANGSALLAHGLTQVLVTVFGPREAKMRSHTLHDRASINVDVNIAAFSTGERRRRPKGDKRLYELGSTIKATFEPVVQTNLYPRSQIDIYVQVLQQDGGLLQTCVNGTTLALINAGIPLLDFVCAVSGGVHVTSPLLDLTQLEESDVPHLTVAVMPRSNKVTLLTMETRLHVERFEQVLSITREAATTIHRELRSALAARTDMLIKYMDQVSTSRINEKAEQGNERRMDEF